MNNNFCQNCGNPLIPNAYACSRCGAPVNSQPIYVVKQKTPGKGFGITSMIMGIVACFYAFYSLIFGLIMSLTYQVVQTSTSTYNYTNTPEVVFEGVAASMSIAFFVYVAIFSALALIFGFCAKSRGFYKGITKSGIVMGFIALGVSLISLIISLCI